MKYFEETEAEDEIILDRIVSIFVEEEKVFIMEKCDDHFSKEFTKETAIEMLQEAIDWIKGGVG